MADDLDQIHSVDWVKFFFLGEILCYNCRSSQDRKNPIGFGRNNSCSYLGTPLTCECKWGSERNTGVPALINQTKTPPATLSKSEAVPKL